MSFKIYKFVYTLLLFTGYAGIIALAASTKKAGAYLSV